MGRLTLTVSLPLPDRRLSPNQAKRGVGARAKAMRRGLAARYRRQVCLLALEASDAHRPNWPAAVLWPFYLMPDARRRDPDNLAASFKPGLDGLVDAGVLVDDRHVLPMPPRVGVDRVHPRLVLIIEPTTPDELASCYLPQHVLADYAIAAEQHALEHCV